MKLFHKALFVAASMTMVVACSENQMGDQMPPPKDGTSARIAAPGGEDRCATMKVLADKLANNPGLARRMEAIEAQTQRFIALQKGTTNTKPGNGGGKPGGGGGGGGTGGGTTDPSVTISIPVFVHVIFNTTDQNISNAQIQSQIDVMNEDFSAQNNDKNKTPSEFSGLIADFNINFTWDPTKDWVRKASNKSSWGTNDAVKSSKRGGSDAVPGYLNIWVCNIGGGILGYAQFPGGSQSTDGIVIGPEYFGSSAKGNGFYLDAPYDLGRTATHEVGHWLNLRHIWGDGGCGVDDFVNDTPLSDGPNYGCPDYPTVRCGTRNMTMNYMDYTYDACMYMFTTGQKLRTRAIFAPDGPRAGFVL